MEPAPGRTRSRPLDQRLDWRSRRLRGRDRGQADPHQFPHGQSRRARSTSGPDKSSEKLTAYGGGQRAPGIDLAILKLDDESFFDKPSRPAPPNIRLPDLKQTGLTYGFPAGGSRTLDHEGDRLAGGMHRYIRSASALRIQVDAAINPGNSGGPAVVNGQLIGLVFSRLQQADNIGYIIPMEEIDLFLQDVQDGPLDTSRSWTSMSRNLENATLHRPYKLDKKAAVSWWGGSATRPTVESAPGRGRHHPGRRPRHRQRGDGARRRKTG